ncbi:MAG: hypothetical protein CMO44_17110 [Verrucomicrobiales bacterium]|nr:hypothetical protein [Verrucomicrobiales bacterium]
MDIGYDKHVGISTMIEYLRETDQMQHAEKIRSTTLKKYIKNNTLESSINMGFTPLDCVCENISWEQLRRKFSVESILKFGMTFDIATKIGLQPEHFGGDEGYTIIEKMKATKQEIHDFIDHISKLKKTNWSPAIAKEAGFTFQKVIDIGGNASTLQSMKSWTIKNIVLEFQPQPEEWLKAEFTSDCTKDEAWDSKQYRQFIAKETAQLSPDDLEEVKINPVSKDYILKFDANKILSQRF